MDQSDVGLASLVLRGVLGTTFVAHGVKHGRSLLGTAGWFESIGFTHPRLQAQASAVVETGAGVALLAGAATPLAASAVVGSMAVAYRTVHEPNGYWITGEGWEYVGFITATAVALSALGPGPFSVDRRWNLHSIGSPGTRAAFVAALGIGGAALQLAGFWRRPARSVDHDAEPTETD